jgi:hypothetical protein
MGFWIVCSGAHVTSEEHQALEEQQKEMRSEKAERKRLGRGKSELPPAAWQ